MALLFPNIGDGLTRSGLFFGLSPSWTKARWVRFVSPPPPVTSPIYQTVWQVGGDVFGGNPSDETPPFIGGFTDFSGFPLFYSYADNGVTHGSDEYFFTPNTWIYLATTYDAEITTVETVANAISVPGSFVLDLSGVSPQSGEWLGTDTESLGNLEVAFDRTWQAKLSHTELLREALSVTPVRQTNLLAASTLADLSDGLTDTTGNGHDWSILGSPEVVDGPSPSGDLCAMLTCSTPPPIPVGAHRQWFLHRFDLKIRGEQTS